MKVCQRFQSFGVDALGLALRRWNWKSALSSSLLRGMIFFFTNLTAGLHAATSALLTELIYRAIASGFYGAITQSLSEVEPAWAATLTAVILLPLGSHALELTVHLLRHTPKLAMSFITSVCFTVLSTLFQLYAMRRGVLLVHAGASAFSEDMSRMPRLVVSFIAAGALALIRGLRKLLSFLTLQKAY